MRGNQGYTSAPGSQQRQMDYLEDWLITLVQHTKRTNELLEAQSRPGSKTDQREDWRIEKLGKRIEYALAGQLSSRLNQAQSIANRGFSGTVEAARMDYAMEQLGRQFAAVMKPVMDALTYGAVQIEQRMRRMSGTDQNALLGMGLGAFAGRMVGGLPGMLLGGVIGSARMGGGSGDGTLVSAGAGAAIGYRNFGVPGALIGGAVGGIAGAPDRYVGESRSDYYDRLRASGSTMVGAGVSGVSDMVRSIFASPTATRPTAAAAAAPRRDVTPFQADMMDAGGTYFAIQKSMIRATAGAGYEESNQFKPFIDLLLEIIGLLAKVAGVEFMDPRSATAAREREVRAMGGASGRVGISGSVG